MRAPTHDVEVEHDVAVAMPDGAVLLTDVFRPVGLPRAPVILERTPYGRSMMGLYDPMPRLLAERGYCFVLQAVRGTDGSDGAQSFFAERADSRAAADWVVDQDWCDGRLGTYGPSYMGFTQWALASTAPPYLRAMAVLLSSTHSSWFQGGALALELMVNWDLSALNFLHPEREGGFAADDLTPEGIERKQRRLQEAYRHLPVGDALLHVAGENHWLFEQQTAHPSSDDPHWAPFRFGEHFAESRVPTLLVGAWFDTPLPGMCEDYQALRALGIPTALRVGGGGHLEGGGEGVADAVLDWLDAYVLDASLPDDGERAPEHPVRLHVQGAGDWRSVADWPPPGIVPTRWYLQPEGRLDTRAADRAAGSSRYRYDPADPTPSFGGTGLMTGGRVDNASLEARDDVLVFTSDVLTEPLELLGPVYAELYVASSLDHTDFFVRVCDVDAEGTSWNVCDGLQRFDPTTIGAGAIEAGADGGFLARVALWPIGHRFAAGHRLRVQVSSGAHPVYTRNLGTGEPPATAVTMRAANQVLFHDVTRPSAVVLPHFPG